MKTPSTHTKTLNLLGSVIALFFTTLVCSPAFAQSNNKVATAVAQNGRIIKGVISDANGPLESATIILKGTKTGTTSDSNGEFTFPTPLNTGDILLVSYLGYETKQASIKEDTTVLRLTLTEDLVEFVGALNSDKPYKSKRSN